MEDTLGERHGSLQHWIAHGVLILVLMEDTLGVRVPIVEQIYLLCLNPCSNGRYSRRVRGVKALFQVGGE